MASVASSIMQPSLYGNAHPLPHSVRDAIDERIQPSLLARKGSLFVVYSSDVAEGALRDLYLAYYGGASFDILPNVRRALAETYRSDKSAVDTILGVALLHGRDLYLVGQEAFAVNLMRGRETSVILDPWQRPGRPLSSTISMPEGSMALYSTFQRLMVGDLVLMTHAELLRARNARTLAALGRTHHSPEALARALAHPRLGRASQSTRPFGAAIRVPGFRAVAGFPERVVRTNSQSAPATTQPRRAKRRSPIWAALVVAAIAVFVAWYVGRPDLSKERFDEILDWALTPVVTETPIGPDATSTPEASSLDPDEELSAAQPTAYAPPTRDDQPAAAAPVQPASPTKTAEPTSGPREFPPVELIEPANGAIVHGSGVMLRWKWDGELGENEYFDVRLWKIGTDPKGIAWTKDTLYTERVLSESGWHEWSVVVVEGLDGVVVAELTTNVPVNSFQWRPSSAGSGQSATEPAATPEPSEPTRVAPDPEPTRDSSDPAPTRVSPGD